MTVLCGELLREAEFLVNQRIHPMTIMAGWRSAVAIARKALEEAAVDHGADQVLFKEDLLNIARTTLSSKVYNSNPFMNQNDFYHLPFSAPERREGPFRRAGGGRGAAPSRQRQP